MPFHFCVYRISIGSVVSGTLATVQKYLSEDSSSLAVPLTCSRGTVLLAEGSVETV